MNKPDYSVEKDEFFKAVMGDVSGVVGELVEDKVTQRNIIERIAFRLMSSMLAPNLWAPEKSKQDTVTKVDQIKAIYRPKTGYSYLVFVVGVAESMGMSQVYYVDKFKHICHDDSDLFEIIGAPVMTDL